MSTILINLFINRGLISKEEKDLFICAIEQLFVYILNILSMIIIGLTLNMLFEAILFTITYIPIRIYAGGYHLKTQLRCYIFSVLMLISVLLILKIKIIISIIPITIITILSSFIIILLSPIEDKNKPLDEIEIKVYRKRAIRNLIIEVLILSILFSLNKANLSFCISISLLYNAIMLILGKIKNFKNNYI